MDNNGYTKKEALLIAEALGLTAYKKLNGYWELE